METKGCVDVVLIEAQMPDMDSYDFVRRVTQQINIPVISKNIYIIITILQKLYHIINSFIYLCMTLLCAVMCDDGSTSAVIKAIANGACEYWIKPLIENQIKNMWQCVARKVLNENKHDLGVLKVKGQSKRGSDDNANYQLLTKKNRISWRSELHQQFLRVVTELGLDSKNLFPIIFILFSYFLCLYTSRNSTCVHIFLSLIFQRQSQKQFIKP